MTTTDRPTYNKLRPRIPVQKCADAFGITLTGPFAGMQTPQVNLGFLFVGATVFTPFFFRKGGVD
jgi:hypothetical protein